MGMGSSGLTHEDFTEAEKVGFQYDHRIGLFVTGQVHTDLKKAREAREIEEIVAERYPKQQPEPESEAVVPVVPVVPDEAEALAYSQSETGALVRIFEPLTLQKLIARVARDSDRSQRQRADLEAGCCLAGIRYLPRKSLREVVDGLRALSGYMPNFHAVIDVLVAELALAITGQAEDFRVSPICMHGAPGIGKTRFARELANVLDVDFESVSMGASPGFELAGTPAGYSNSTSGRIWRLLADGHSACPVLLLDEADKMSDDHRLPSLPTVLDLLEVDSARNFRDEALEARFDASKIIVLLTANEANDIPAPLQSRARMIEIEPPTQEQRREIAGRIAMEFTSVGVNFETPVLDAVCELDIDLRALRRFLRQAAGEALSDQKTSVVLADVSIPAKPVERRIGFR